MSLGITDFYIKNYKKFLFLPFIILVIGFILVLVQYQNTGDFIIKDISLKGGVTLTILEEQQLDLNALKAEISQLLAPNDVSIRTVQGAGKQVGILIESDIPELTEAQLNSTFNIVEKASGNKIDRQKYSIETTGSALSSSFFQQTIRAMIIAFLFMGLVVFLYFRSFVPSAAVVLSAFSDIVVTIAVINIMGVKIGTAGIAALLMLIGYSIDTDIMLTTRVLKRKDSSLKDSVRSAFITGMTMTLTTIAAVTVAFIFTESEVIKQIMLILLIGLIIDILNTWVQNSGLLIWYVGRKK